MRKNEKKILVSVVFSNFVSLMAVFIFTTIFCILSVSSSPAKNLPVQMEADTISYDAKEEIFEAVGNVTITQGESIITAQRAEYNVKNKEGRMTGGVKAHLKDEDVILTADEIISYDQNERVLAKGNVVVLKGEDRLVGTSIDYNVLKQYAMVTGTAKIETKDAVMTADKLEVFFQEERAIGNGNVHIVSESRGIDATADQADYYGLPKESGKVVLTGNARVTEKGNLFTGETLTVGLGDKMIGAQGGRPRLVFIP